MKKIISLVLCAVLTAALLFSLTGCSGKTEMTEENIRDAAAHALTALQEFDTDALGKYVDSQTLGVIIPFAEKQEAFRTLGKAMFASLTMEVVKADAQNGTVTVRVQNKDLYADASAFAGKLNREYSKLQLIGLVENEAFIHENLNPLIEQIEAAPMQQEATEVILTVQQDKRNLKLSFDETAEDAVSGGALGAIKSVFGV